MLIEPNDTTEIEGFLKGSNVTNKFKFIEKTSEIEDFRGNKIDDGLIRISFEFEKKIIIPKPVLYRNSYIVDNDIPFLYRNSYIVDNDIPLTNTCVNDNGITVKGSESDQSFVKGSFGFPDGNKHVIVIQLKGKTSSNTTILEPVTIQKNFNVNLVVENGNLIINFVVVVELLYFNII